MSAKQAIVERVVVTLSLMVFFVLAYFAVGLSRNPADAHVLTTPIDERIPFISSSVWVYLGVFPFALTPLFVVKCPCLFRRTVAAYVLVIAFSCVIFVLFPATSIHLRVPQTSLDMRHFSDWAVARLYIMDPPYNLFPSLHVSIATLAAVSVRKATKSYGAPVLACLALFVLSVCTTKQHCLLDILGGLALAFLVASVTLKPYRAANRAFTAYSWRGLFIYVVFVFTVYGAVWIAFLFAS